MVAPTQHLIILIGLAFPHAVLVPRSGDLDLYTSSLRDIGYAGTYWLASAYSHQSQSYYLNYATNLSPAFYNTRSYGFSLRCLSSLPRPSGRGIKQSIIKTAFSISTNSSPLS